MNCQEIDKTVGNDCIAYNDNHIHYVGVRYILIN